MKHRDKLGMTGNPLELMDVECDTLRLCYANCPLPEDQRVNPSPKKSSSKENLGKEVRGQSGVEGGIITKPVKQKKQKEISKDVENFLWMQSSVISKLAWRPEIWRALYKLSVDEILDRLVGKTGLEAVPTIAGGTMQFEASKQTKQMFADLEKQFADEDEKKGKPEPKGDWGGLGDCVDEPHGYFEKGVWKNGKKNKNVPKKS